jgi:hypothetical protein
VKACEEGVDVEAGAWLLIRAYLTISGRYDLMSQSLMKLPEALEKSGWKNPSGDPMAFQAAFGVGQNAFSVLGARPSSLADFNNLMAQQRLHRAEWFDIFPVQERLLDGFEPGDAADATPLLVDVGGAHGYEAALFKKRYPSVKGQVFLQDLPHTIDSITSLDESIVRMKHDFFTPQPVKGKSDQIVKVNLLIISRSTSVLLPLDFPRLG